MANHSIEPAIMATVVTLCRWERSTAMNNFRGLPIITVALASALLCSCGASTPTAGQPSSTQRMSPASAPASRPLLVFYKAGTLSLVWPDGTVAHELQTPYGPYGTGLHQFDSSAAVVIGQDYASQALLTRDGVNTPIAPAAAALISTERPIVTDAHTLLGVQGSDPTINYIRLDLATGTATTLLSATPLPSSRLPIVPHLLALGTSLDHSVAHVFVDNVVVSGKTITGAAYFDINVQSRATTGPHALPSGADGSIAMSADGRYAAWVAGGAPISGNATWDLHILDLAKGTDSTVPNVPYVAPEGSVGLRFSPDDTYVSLEGSAGPAQPSSYGYMGIAVIQVKTARVVQVVNVTHVSLDEIGTVGWTGPHALVYSTNNTTRSGIFDSSNAVGHSLDAQSGSKQDSPAGLGAPVLMLG